MGTRIQGRKGTSAEKMKTRTKISKNDERDDDDMKKTLQANHKKRNGVDGLKEENETKHRKMNNTEENNSDNNIDENDNNNESEGMGEGNNDVVTCGDGVPDLATTLGFKPGDRIEVEWEVLDNDDDDDESNIDNKNKDTGKEKENGNGNDVDNRDIIKRWWGATLMEHDGRTEDSGVAIRVLDYDPYPEGGFPERSQEDVIFLGRDLLVDPVTHEELHYRREGEEIDHDDENSSSNTDSAIVGKSDIEKVVNETLMNAMKKNSAAWNSLTRAQQAMIAEKIAIKKEKLVNLLLNQPDGTVITSSNMKSILAQTMQDEDGK